MDQEAFEIAVEKELEDIFGYSYHMAYGHIVKQTIPAQRPTYKVRKSYKAIAIFAKFARVILAIFVGILALFLFIESELGPQPPVQSAMRSIAIGASIIITLAGIELLVLYKYKKLRKEKKKKIKEEKTAEEMKKQRLLKTLIELDKDVYNESVGKGLTEIKEIAKIYSTQEANKLLAREDIRKHICPALKSVTDDVFDISKAVTPVLVGCVVAGTISIPLNPVLFAAIAVVIARIGILALCAGFITK